MLSAFFNMMHRNGKMKLPKQVSEGTMRVHRTYQNGFSYSTKILYYYRDKNDSFSMAFAGGNKVFPGLTFLRGNFENRFTSSGVSSTRFSRFQQCWILHIDPTPRVDERP